MSAHPLPFLTPEEYLAIERAAEFRSEYFDGHMYAMSGGTHVHAIITHNTGVAIDIGLSGRPCIVTTSDLRVRVQPGGLYTYPDVVVVCGVPKYADDQRDTLLNPTLIIEVLSPSTERYDRIFKSSQYRTIESLREYVTVWQKEPRLEVLRRSDQGDWVLWEFAGLDAVCRLESIGCDLALSAVYKNVTFGPEGRP